MYFAEGWARWQGLMQQIGVFDHSNTFNQLMVAYSEPHRFYHTTEHIAACLRELELTRNLAESPAEVELALWFHDAVYDVRSHTNELDSAQWAVQFLQHAGDGLTISSEHVYDHILATAHLSSIPEAPTPEVSTDSALVVNIDLTILGQHPAIYNQFEANIRREYQHVSIDLYRQKRREVLQHFLHQPEIFSMMYFRERYERAARQNLEGAISSLS
ncbi:MAG: hypothetical protein AAGF01_20780 [Cyanobacteria bacterium P01_G01_bin.38]